MTHTLKITGSDGKVYSNESDIIAYDLTTVTVGDIAKIFNENTNENFYDLDKTIRDGVIEEVADDLSDRSTALTPHSIYATIYDILQNYGLVA